jgi:hypothetical protein
VTESTKPYHKVTVIKGVRFYAVCDECAAIGCTHRGINKRACRFMIAKQQWKEDRKMTVSYEFNYCPVCMQYRAHRPGVDQCIVCETSNIKRTKEEVKNET